MKKWAYTNSEDNGGYGVWPNGLDITGGQRLNDNFTELVMEQIRSVEMLPASNVKQGNLSGLARRRRTRRGLQWGSAFVATICAMTAVLFLLDPSAPQPVLSSSTSQRLHILPNEWADYHLLNAKKLGVIQQPNIEVTDGGYTVTLQEVVADPNRLMLNIRITDKNGQPADEAMSMFDTDQLQLRNADGREVGKLRVVDSMETMLGKDKFRQEYLLLTYIFPDEQPGDTLFIQGNIHNLVTHHKDNQSVQGDWSFSYKADLQTANKHTTITDLGKSYSSPDGMEIEMEQLVQTPAGIKLTFSTSLKDTAIARTPADLLNNQGVMFHFESATGDMLTAIRGENDGVYTLDTTDSSGKFHWTYYFYELPVASKDVRFVLDGYNVPVRSNDSFTFRPQDLKKTPSVFKAHGDTMYVNSMKINQTTQHPGLSGWMAISGTFSNKFALDKWIAEDDQGTKYDVTRWGSYNHGETVTFGQTGYQTNLIYLIAKGMTALPKELTLTRTITDMKYTNVDWSFELP
ncbi:DUF4179 domain-containing protein [Paenibacillus sp. BAC0078]